MKGFRHDCPRLALLHTTFSLFGNGAFLSECGIITRYDKYTVDNRCGDETEHQSVLSNGSKVPWIAPNSIGTRRSIVQPLEQHLAWHRCVAIITRRNWTNRANHVFQEEFAVSYSQRAASDATDTRQHDHSTNQKAPNN